MTDHIRKGRTPDPASATAQGRPSSGARAPESPAFAPFDMSPLLDTVEFARNAWLSFGVPSSLTPTIDPEEVDRRIQDLKTVEQWLSMNLNMLKTSIQALELQRGALAALKRPPWPAPSAQGREPGPRPFRPQAPAADRAAAAQAAGDRSDDGTAQAASGPAATDVPGFDASAWWDLLQRQFEQVTAAVLQPGPADAPTAGAAAPGSRPGGADPAAAGGGGPTGQSTRNRR